MGYNITHRGSCKEKGFTEPAELTSFGQNIIKSLQRIDGACKGMTLMKFKKPEKNNDDNKEPEKTNDDRNENICGPGQLPYEAFNARHPDACAVYCVPNSD